MTVRIFWLICALLSGFSGAGQLFAAEINALKSSESPGPPGNENARSQIYTHPVRGFTIAVPPGAKLFERDEKNPQISIRSRKGYMVSVQSGPVQADVPLAAMLLRLEAKYLGRGKQWSHKGKQSRKVISGLAAIEGFYEGASTRTRVDIIRGRQTDHVFMFFAPSREYQKLEYEYDWMLAQFRPGPDDLIKPQVTMSSSSAKFEAPGYGYSIHYPANWVHSTPSRMTAMFSGAEGSEGYAAIVSIQNIAPQNAASSEAAAKQALTELKSSLLKSVQNLQFHEDKPWSYVRDRYHLNGRELIISYQYAGESFMKRIVVVPRPTQKLAHIWSYTAPVGIFKTYLDTANRMLKSWVIIGAGKN